MLNKKIKIEKKEEDKRKKILFNGVAIVLVVFIIISILFFTVKFNGLMGNSVDTKEKMSSYYLGDFDLDGKITQNDYYELEKYVDALNSDEEKNIDEIHLIVGDLDEDGEISGKDLFIFKDYIEKIPSTYKSYYDKIGIERKCLDGYEVRENYCLKKQKSYTYYTINYEGNGATKLIMMSQFVNYGTPTKLSPNTFVKEGYLFVGWKAERDDNTYLCFKNSEDERNKKSYWVKKNECYRYDLYSDEAIVSKTVDVGHTVTMIAIWEPENNSGNSGSNSTNVEENKYYIVKYYSGAKNATGFMLDQEMLHGEKNSLKKNKFKNLGYTFVGWKAKRDDNTYLCFRNSEDERIKKSYWVISKECYKYDLYSDEAIVSNTAEVGHTVKMIATWEPETKVSSVGSNSVNIEGNKYFTVKYDSGVTNSTGSMADQKMLYGEKNILNANNFKRSGYKFVGWKAKRDDNKYLCFKNYADVLGKKSYWLKNKECYKYDLYSNQASVSKTVEVGHTVTMIATWEPETKTSSSGSQTTKATTSSKAKTIIKFDAQGGTGKMLEQTINAGETKNVSENHFSRNGYKFIGWRVLNQTEGNKYLCKDSNGGTSYKTPQDCAGKYVKIDNNGSITAPKKNTTLVLLAQWEYINGTLDIRFDGEGGISPYGNVENQEIFYGSLTPLRKNVYYKSDYDFIGWWAELRKDSGIWYCYTNSSHSNKSWVSAQNCYEHVLFKDGEKVFEKNVPAFLVTMHAQWKPVYFTVKFNPGAGYGSMPDQKVRYGTSTKLRKVGNSIRKTDREFAYWWAKRGDGSEYCYTDSTLKNKAWVFRNCYKHVEYYDGDTVSKTAKPGTYVTMIAQWKNVSTFTVKYDGNGASGRMNNRTYIYGGDNQYLDKNQFSMGKDWAFVGWEAERGDKTIYCYTNKSKTEKDWVYSNKCVEPVIYKDGQQISKTAKPNTVVTMSATFRKKVCTTTYECRDRGTLVDHGSYKRCVINYGKANIVTDYKCPKSNMKKTRDGKKCYYTSSTKIPGTNIYRCAQGGSNINGGKTCYVDAIEVKKGCSVGKYDTGYCISDTAPYSNTVCK